MPNFTWYLWRVTLTAEDDPGTVFIYDVEAHSLRPERSVRHSVWNRHHQDGHPAASYPGEPAVLLAELQGEQ